nr:zinc ribbon domain-containing protein [Eubacterium sp.]
MKYIPLIIILVLILAIIISIYVGVQHIRRKTREFSLQVFGTENITQAAEQMRQEYATTPKSVSAMTSLMLPRITKDFPEFQYDEMKERAINVLTSYLQAITLKDMAGLTDAGEELKEQLRQHLQMLSNEGKHEHFDQVQFHRTEISQYRKTDGRCIITFQSAIGCYHYITNSNGSIIEGTKDYKYQTRFNVDLLYVQNRDLVEDQATQVLGVHCPNCGAPIKALGDKFCEYCGSPVTEINLHAWTFCNIEEKK